MARIGEQDTSQFLLERRLARKRSDARDRLPRKIRAAENAGPQLLSKSALEFASARPNWDFLLGRCSVWCALLSLGLSIGAGCRNWDEDQTCEPVGSTARSVTGACVSFAAPVEVGRVQDSALLEASGLQASRAHPGVLYTHNDSGDGARFFALDSSGRTLGEYFLSGLTALDWEDVAIGPGRSGGDELYFADIGDNSVTDSTIAPRSEIQIVRVREPDVSPTQARVQQTVSAWDRILLTYPDRSHDAETLLVDPNGSDLWILTKEVNGRSEIFSAPAASPAETRVVLKRVGEVWLGGCGGGPQLTAGDISPDGTLVLLRTYQAVLLWERPAGTSLPDALAKSPWTLRAPNELQGEAITFSAEGGAWLTIGEGASAPIFRAVASCP